MLLDYTDRVLSRFFHVLGFKKCSRCAVRIRLRQLALLGTWPLQAIPAIRSRRIDWRQQIPSAQPLPALTALPALYFDQTLLSDAAPPEEPSHG